jgi:hypothetical protein
MTTEPVGQGSPRVRASDAEREEYARIIRDSVGEGRLNLDEGDERLAALYAAKFRDELPSLIADLPAEGWDQAQYGRSGSRRRSRSGDRGEAGRPSAGGSSAGEWQGRRGPGRPDPGGRDGGWPGPGWRAGGPRGSGWQWAARRRLGRHAMFVIVVGTVLVTIWALTASGFFWPLIPLAFLAFGLFRHACWVGAARHHAYRDSRSDTA